MDYVKRGTMKFLVESEYPRKNSKKSRIQETALKNSI